MYLSKEELKMARKLASQKVELPNVEELSKEEIESIAIEAKKSLDLAIKDSKEFEEKCRKIKEFIEAEYSKDEKKDLIFALLIAFLE